MTWLIIGIAIAVLVGSVLKTLEYNEGSISNPRWVKESVPRWVWLVITAACLIPIINVILLFIAIITVIVLGVQEELEDYRWWGGNSLLLRLGTWLSKDF